MSDAQKLWHAANINPFWFFRHSSHLLSEKGVGQMVSALTDLPPVPSALKS
jgi:hypothetical protein